MDRVRPAIEEYNTAVGMTNSSVTFEGFFESERDRLFGVLCVITGDRHEAEEVAQEAFLRVWERWDRVSELENPAGYLERTAMNTFRKHHRRAGVWRRISTRLPAAWIAGEPDAEFLVSESLRVLTPRQRAALVLTEFLGYSAEEAGLILGVKASTIGALKHQGREVLKKVAEASDE